MIISSPICIDANLIFRRYVEPDNEPVQRLWREWETTGQALVAPRLIGYELTNALHRVRRAGLISTDTARVALSLALELPIAYSHAPEDHAAALDFAARFNLPAAYDAHYLALADRLGAEFWTGDQRLVNTVGRSLPWVRLAGSTST